MNRSSPNDGESSQVRSDDTNPFVRKSRIAAAGLNEGTDVMKWKVGVVVCLGSLALLAPVQGAESKALAGRVGVYDSRVVAYAWFSSDANMAKLRAEVATAQVAKSSGDTAKFKELSTALRAKQDQIHRELFSTVPIDEALGIINARIPEIEKTASVSDLVSKWDARLENYPAAQQVDVTDQLVHAFITPSEQQSKVMESIIKAKPLPLDKCNELIKNGQI